MALTPDEHDAIEEMLSEVNSVVGAVTDTVEHDARTVLREAFEETSGYIELLDDPFQIYADDRHSLAELPLEYESVYGIDAGTTRPESYTNGLVIDIANAKVAMLGEGSDDIERAATIVGAYYHKDDNIELGEQTLRSGDLTCKLLSVEPSQTRSLREQVSVRARTMAEGMHAETIAPQLDGPLFRDGSIYPMALRQTLLFAKGLAVEGGADLTGTAGKAQEKEIVDRYIHAIDAQYENGYPLIGIVKTMSTDQLVSAVEQKLLKQHDEVNLPWNRDDQFLSSALYVEDPETVTFTSWLVETVLNQNGREIEPLEGFDLADPDNPQLYRRAFFYVRLPTTGTVFRIEAPLMMVLSEDDRRSIQRLVLNRMVRAGDTPEVVKRADDRARIPQQTAKTFKERFLRDMHAVKGYNRDGRYEQYSYENAYSNNSTNNE